MEEKWVDIQGYEGLYQISNHGNVRSLDRPVRTILRNKMVSTRIVKGKNLKPKFNGTEYLGVILSKENKQKTLRINRLVGFHFLVKGENHTQVNHIDGNKFNNHVNNLEWCTAKENMKHAYEIGLRKGGQDCNLSKLTEVEVLQIVELKRQGKRSVDVSRAFNISVRTVNRILHGDMWCKLTKIEKRVAQ